MKNNTNKDYIYSNAKLHYTLVSGNSDTPLVLIHGQCMCGLDYENVIEKLNNGKKKVVRSGHDIHFEKPRHFLNAMKMLEKML